MTTNNLGVKRYELESGYDSMMRRVNRMRESEDGVYVRFDDYEALQADYQRLQAECDALLTEVSDLREKVRYFEDTVCCPDMRVMLSNGCSTMAIDPERVADLVRERDRLRQTAGKAAPDVEALVEALECMIIGACAVAVPHNGERAVLQDAVSIARKALAAYRKQEGRGDE